MENSALPVDSTSNLVMIDNYDSFTYNVYQYLVLEGASVSVYRNDEITLEQLIKLCPTQLVISPGPGNPEADAGISNEAISYFAGKIPILGVCMGEQCIYTVFGGKVDVTGEILHGKTSPLKHDSRGIYQDLPQNLPVTRYHSLAGTHLTLPDCLEISSWTSRTSGSRQEVIMGVRHKVFVVEGMQFHPESILTEQGRVMLQNFLRMRGGTWDQLRMLQENVPHAEYPSVYKGHTQSEAVKRNGTTTSNGQKQSILDEIFERRKIIIEAQKDVPSLRPSDLQATYDLRLYPPQIDFASRLRMSPFALSLIAEVKRASPSKGNISLDIYAPAQAKKYALAGASVISVLTEPQYFKGAMHDLRAARQILEGMPNRPAILCKDFIFDVYQILEARLAGADTVLLIVKMLSETVLVHLYEYCHSLNMEPLVEVNNEEEMRLALKLGAKVIGVNNRNLTSFEVDLNTTTRLLSGVSEGTAVCALSGIAGREDLETYRKNRVSAVLVGEALMRAADVGNFVQELLGQQHRMTDTGPKKGLNVKICGTRTPEAAKAAVQAGADMIGIILVAGRRRFVPRETALEISKVVHSTPKPGNSQFTDKKPVPAAIDYFEHSREYLSRPQRALLVGVFCNQPLEHILEQQKLLDLDIVQLHGNEPIEWARAIPVPVIRRFDVQDHVMSKRGYHSIPLLDASFGGTGEVIDVEGLRAVLDQDDKLQVVLAGGLTSTNLTSIFQTLGSRLDQVVAVDVSSGVEEEGEQSHEKIIEFIKTARHYSGGLNGYNGHESS